MTSNQATSPVAIITGAARGIGLATSEWFLAHGYRVAMIDVDGTALREAAASVSDPTRVLGLDCDVSDPAQVDAMVGQVSDRLGRIDALVNNAGVAVFKPLLETSFQEWRHVFAVNLDGAFLCTLLQIDLIKADLVGTLACNRLVGHGLAAQMTPCHGIHVVGPVRLQHVRFKQGVVLDPFQTDAVVLEHVHVVLEVLAKLAMLITFKPGLELVEHGRAIKLLRHPGIGMGERDIAGTAGLNGQRNTDQLRHHRIQRRGLSINRRQRRRLDAVKPALQGFICDHGFVFQRRQGRYLDAGERIDDAAIAARDRPG